MTPLLHFSVQYIHLTATLHESFADEDFKELVQNDPEH